MAVEMLEKSTTGETTNGKTAQSRTLVLFGLWTLEADKNPVKKSELPDKVKKMQDVFQQLESEGAIAFSKQGRSVTVSLKESGVQLLDEALRGNEFAFNSQIGVKSANSLLRWFRERNGSTSVPTTNGKVHSAINSYEGFKQVALDVYDRLNRDYNLDNLVPIYRIRREIGDQVSRSHFDEWLLEMQSSDILQLIGGEMPELTPDKAEDSIKTALGGVRYYVKQL